MIWPRINGRPAEIVLGTKNATENSLQEIPFADSFIKQAIDITADARDALFSRWEQRLSRTKGVLPGESLRTWIEEEKKYYWRGAPSEGAKVLCSKSWINQM